MAMSVARTALACAGVLALWLAIEGSAAHEARRLRRELTAVQARAVEVDRLQRALDQQMRLGERLQTRLARQQLEVEACATALPFEDARSTAEASASAGPTRANVVLTQIEERVEVAPGGPMTPITQ
jgi:phosphopantothenate synthetase